MTNSRKPCKATTLKGQPCPYRAREGSDYCGHHKQEAEIVRSFFEKHGKAAAGFIVGVAFDPVAGDIYDHIKELTGMKRLVPPVREETAAQLSAHWKRHKDPLSLYKMLPHLKMRTQPRHTRKLLGRPQEEKRDKGACKTIYLTKNYFDIDTMDARARLILQYTENGGLNEIVYAVHVPPIMTLRALEKIMRAVIEEAGK